VFLWLFVNISLLATTKYGNELLNASSGICYHHFSNMHHGVRFWWTWSILVKKMTL
jgi:hypothetical protein